MEMDRTAAAANERRAALNVKKSVIWFIFIIFFSVLNETVFNVATPEIAADFGLEPSEVSLIVTSFATVFSIGSVVYGKLSDLYSLKKLLLIGLLLYCGGSLLGLLAHASYPAVIAARIVQGLGCSSVAGLIMVIVIRYFAVNDRGKMFGIIGSTVAFSEGVGPVIGGLVAGHYHWSLLFVFPLFTLFSLPYVLKVLPDEPSRKGSIDGFGAGLLTVGLAAFIMFWTDLHWLYLLVSGVFVGWFALHIRRVGQPFIEPSLFANRAFIGGICSGIALFGAAMGVLFMMPLMLSHVHHLTSDAIGWIMFPGSISVIVFGFVGGSLADRLGNRPVFYWGTLLMIASLLVLSLYADRPPWLLSGALVLTYIGISFVKTALSSSISMTLQQQEEGVGMGLYNLTSFFSETVGIALIGRALENPALGSAIAPTVMSQDAHLYSNLLLIMAVVCLIGGALYRSVFRQRQ